MLDENKKIGIGLCAIGVVCLVLGIFLLFDRTLLALGNVAFLLGLFVLLGMKAGKFFFRKEKLQGSVPFFLGIAAIIYGWPFCGFVIELYGIWHLFRSFLPNALTFLKNMVPGASIVLAMPPFSYLSRMIYDSQKLPV
mmetsp:Transcript_116760/g.183604  ORF Transcript_116760/g.183604 Transcript_116760/m.183604 type:complete len:138 (+) Transcript_116760:74-487(+)